MKLRNQFKLMLAMTVMGSGLAQAALIDRGGGMIYDDVLDVTWLQDANYAKTSGYDADGKMGWYEANNWAQNLIYGGYDDWRLPNVKPVNHTSFNYDYSTEGITDYGYNIVSSQSEMAYMYYYNLGNIGRYGVNGQETGCFLNCLSNTGMFKNLQEGMYWAGGEYPPSSDFKWMFGFNEGFQGDFEDFSQIYAWAVRSGDVAPVPVPAAVWLFGSALIGLVSVSGKKKDIL